MPSDKVTAQTVSKLSSKRAKCKAKLRSSVPKPLRERGDEVSDEPWRVVVTVGLTGGYNGEGPGTHTKDTEVLFFSGMNMKKNNKESCFLLKMKRNTEIIDFFTHCFSWLLLDVLMQFS